MTEKQVRAMMLAKLKVQARRQNKQGRWSDLTDTLREFDRVCRDDRAAIAFYTELERAVEDER